VGQVTAVGGSSPSLVAAYTRYMELQAAELYAHSLRLRDFSADVQRHLDRCLEHLRRWVPEWAQTGMDWEPASGVRVVYTDLPDPAVFAKAKADANANAGRLGCVDVQ
jgi:hypothetical protein